MNGADHHDGHVGDLVSAHLDGELDAETSALVRDHLDGCALCRELAADTEIARAWLRALPDVDATPVVEHLLARHRSAIRAGAAFVGLAAVVVGSLALTAAVIRPEVVPDIDALVDAHLATNDADAPAGPVDVVFDLEGMSGAKGVGRVGTPYSAPIAMGNDRATLSRRAMYDGDDLTLVVYENGSVVVSVFQQPGQLDWDALPPGRTGSHGGRTVWSPAPRAAARPAASDPAVFVAQIGHLVVTAVSDDSDAAAAVVAGLPESHRDSPWDRLHDACSRFIAVFSLRG